MREIFSGLTLSVVGTLAVMASAILPACAPGSGPGSVSPAELLEPATAVERVILDVRTPDEYASGRVPGAINIPHTELPQRLSELGAPDREIVVYCESGRRAGIAAELLGQAGYTRVRHLEGHMRSWRAGGWPCEGC